MPVFMGTLNLAEGRLHYAGAGHPRPRWWRPCRQAVHPFNDIAGLPLGLMPEAAYEHNTIEIGHGDVLVLHTEASRSSRTAWSGRSMGRETRVPCAAQVVVNRPSPIPSKHGRR